MTIRSRAIATACARRWPTTLQRGSPRDPTSDPAGTNRRYILIGDFNAYFGEDPIQTLLGSAGYTNLIDELLGESAYSYNFGSQRGYLDHALANASALPLVKNVVELHINSDEPAAVAGARQQPQECDRAGGVFRAERVRLRRSRSDRHRVQSAVR